MHHASFFRFQLYYLSEWTRTMKMVSACMGPTRYVNMYLYIKHTITENISILGPPPPHLRFRSAHELCCWQSLNWTIYCSPHYNLSVSIKRQNHEQHAANIYRYSYVQFKFAYSIYVSGASSSVAVVIVFISLNEVCNMSRACDCYFKL